MKPYSIIALMLVAIAALGHAQQKTKKHSDISAAFQNARYVYVEAADGDVMKPGLYPADRQAIYDMEDGMRDWNRYTLTLRREQADLVFVVRKGRIASAEGHGGISVGTRSQGSQIPGHNPNQAGNADDSVSAGGEVGSEDDLLRVYTLSSDGKLMGPIWTRETTDGLDAPSVQLLRQLRVAVDRAYPIQPASNQPKP